MPENEGGRIRCLMLLPSGEAFESLRRTLNDTATEMGVEVLSGEESQAAVFSLSVRPWVSPLVARADLVVADVSDRSPEVFAAMGLAAGTGRTILMLLDERAGVPPLEPVPGHLIVYGRTDTGLARLRHSFRAFLRDFRRFPRRHRTLGSPELPFPPSPPIDLEKLEPREFENLCFELLSQMGFRRVEWEKEAREFDVVATLVKKDPDGFEYQELWLISMGLHAPVEMLLERAALDPDFILSGVLGRPEVSEGLRPPARADTFVTVLFILFREEPPAEFFRRQLSRMERHRGERNFPLTVRFRFWDRDLLTNLIREYPQIGYKYFSEEGRAQSKYRKTPEELYKEVVALNERLQATLGALEAERDKRVRAERDAIWKDLSFTAAHKLGNPIFALETDLQGLEKRIKDRASDALEVAQEMGASLEKAKVIVEQFKSLTKAQEISPRPIDIAPLIERACRIARQNGIQLEARLPDNRPPVMADPNRMAECFDELVANSMHWFDKPEKRILVALEVPRREDLPPALDRSQRYVKVRFQDNGPGVPLESKERIFAPFFTTCPHGTGLGLALVQRAMEGHKGLIQERGKPGEGALFEIYLPIAKKGDSER